MIPGKMDSRFRIRLVLGLALLLGAVRPTSAQTGDPVEVLRGTLQNATGDLAVRQRDCEAQIKALSGLSALRRALLLSEWRDEDLSTEVQAVDRALRSQVARRFEEAVREVLARGDTPTCLAVAHMLADMSASAEALAGQHGWMRVYGADLAKLARHADAGVRAAATLALGQVHASPKVARPVFQALLSGKEVADRHAAVEGVLAWMKAAVRASAFNGSLREMGEIRTEVIETGCAVVALSGSVLGDPDVAVRRYAAESVELAAGMLSRLAIDQEMTGRRTDLPAMVRPTARDDAELARLTTALRDQSVVLGKALQDDDFVVRVRARRALEDLARVPVPTAGMTNDNPLGQVGFRPQAGQPVRQELLAKLPELARALEDSDVRGRLAAIDVLEALGPAAAPAVPALVKALGDPDRFVRWAAVRTLGRVGPTEGKEVVPAVASLLRDSDLDLRLAALKTLEQYGPAAADAVPQLQEALSARDVAVRVATIKTLVALGSTAEKAMLGLVTALDDEEARVRVLAARAVGRFGATAKDAVPALQRTLAEDTDPEVRQAAADALLAVQKVGTVGTPR